MPSGKKNQELIKTLTWYSIDVCDIQMNKYVYIYAMPPFNFAQLYSKVIGNNVMNLPNCMLVSSDVHVRLCRIYKWNQLRD